MSSNQLEREGDDARVRLVVNTIFVDPLDPDERVLLAKHPDGFWEPLGGKKKFTSSTGRNVMSIELSAATANAEVQEELAGFPRDYPQSRFHHLAIHEVGGSNARHITRYVAVLPEGYLPQLSSATNHIELRWFTLAELETLKKAQDLIENEQRLVRVGETVTRKEVALDLLKLLDSRLRTGSVTTACFGSRHLIKGVFYDPRKNALLLRKKAPERGCAFPYIQASDPNIHLHDHLWSLTKSILESSQELLGRKVWLSSGITPENTPAWVHFYLLYHADISPPVTGANSDWCWLSLGDTSMPDGVVDENYRHEIVFVRDRIKELLMANRDTNELLKPIIRPDISSQRGSIVLDWNPQNPHRK